MVGENSVYPRLEGEAFGAKKIWYSFVTSVYEMKVDLNDYFIDGSTLRVTYLEDSQVFIIFKGRAKYPATAQSERR